MERFGKFALAMVPGDLVQDSWVEGTGAVGFDAFLGLIEQFNTNVACLKQYEFLLDRMLSGQPPPSEVCRLEMATEEDFDGLDNADRIDLLRFCREGEQSEEAIEMTEEAEQSEVEECT